MSAVPVEGDRKALWEKFTGGERLAYNLGYGDATRACVNLTGSVPVEGDRERLAALLASIDGEWTKDSHGEGWYAFFADRLLRAGVSLTGSGLDVERLRRAYHVEYTSGDNRCDHDERRSDCRDRAEETVHWDRLAALSGESGEPKEPRDE